MSAICTKERATGEEGEGGDKNIARGKENDQRDHTIRGETMVLYGYPLHWGGRKNAE